ncbi:MAG TPA: DUF5915 domain-containing protein [Pseudonocardiaceae bacterium]|nr:DUF5915 domain-containing protein [Pseudonocardiaceae bacterium]
MHLARWPQPDTHLLDPKLSAQVALARVLTEAGRAARKTSNIRLRQPLSRALVGLPAGAELVPALLDDISDELNVKRLDWLDPGSEVLDVHVKPNFRQLGKRFGKQTQQVALAILAEDPRTVVSGLRSLGTVQIMAADDEITIGPNDVLVTEVPRSGWVVESQHGVTIALDKQITPELAAEGIARDVVRVVQQARRQAGLDVPDQIALSIAASQDVLAAVRAHQKFISHETLAVSMALSDALSEEGFAGTVGAAAEIVVSVIKV